MSICKSKAHLYLQVLTFKRRNASMFIWDESFRFIITCQLSGKMNIQRHKKNHLYHKNNKKNITDCSGRYWISCLFKNLSITLKVHLLVNITKEQAPIYWVFTLRSSVHSLYSKSWWTLSLKGQIVNTVSCAGQIFSFKST